MSRKPRKNISPEVEAEVYTSDEDEMVAIPNPNDSGCSDTDNSDDEKLLGVTYDRVCKSYQEDQDKLEKNPQFNWKDGEKNIVAILKMKFC